MQTPAVREPISLSDRIDELPLSGFHYRLVGVSGVGWMFDAMDVGLMSFVLPAIIKEWNLLPMEIGWASSMALIGMLAGAVIAGFAADRYGRKRVFLSTLVLFSAATGLCGLSRSFHSLLALRFLVGLGLGGELPVAASLVAEFSPKAHRGKLVCLLDSFWSLGWALAAAIAFLAVPKWGWRSVFFVGSIPALYAVFLRREVPESPRFLSSAGRPDEALRVVRSIEKLCGTPAVELTAAAGAARSPGFRALWSGPMGRQSAMLWVLWFVLGYSYFGIYSWLPSLLVASGHTVVQSLRYTLIIALAQAPGFLSAAFLVDRWGRIATLTVYRVLLAAACFFFGYQAVSPAQIMFWGCLISFFGMGSWGVAYTYTTEIYPTALRTTGAGWATAMARVGGILAPLAIGRIMAVSGSQKLVFWHMTAITLIGVVIVLILGRETRGTSLDAAL
jgi:putative MFS transporter